MFGSEVDDVHVDGNYAFRRFLPEVMNVQESALLQALADVLDLERRGASANDVFSVDRQDAVRI